MLISLTQAHGTHRIPPGIQTDQKPDYNGENKHQDGFLINLLKKIISDEYSLDYNVYISIFLIFLPSFLVMLLFGTVIQIRTIQMAKSRSKRKNSGSSDDSDEVDQEICIPQLILKPLLTMAAGS